MKPAPRFSGSLCLIFSLLLASCGGGGAAGPSGSAPIVDDHGNTPATATQLGNGASAVGMLDYPGDVDAFQLIQAPAGLGLVVVQQGSGLTVQWCQADGAACTRLAGSLSAGESRAVAGLGGGYLLVSGSGNGKAYRIDVRWDQPVSGGVIGIVEYEDRQDVPGAGYTLVPKPARFVSVEAVDPYGVVLGSVTTDAYGRFSMAGNASWMGKQIYFRAVSSGSHLGATATVHDAQGLTFAVAGTTGAYDPYSIRVENLLAGFASGGAAFNILDCVVDAEEFLNTLGVAPPLTLNVLWYPGNVDGTFYDPMTGQIHLLGMSNDDDGYDDSVIIHEYGHFVLQHFSRDDSPGGTHYFMDNQQDLRMSWSEGFANFWATVVRAARGDPYATEYLDTDGHGIELIRFNLESLTQFGAPDPVFTAAVRGMANEVAVAAVLQDIVDPYTNEGFDQVEAPASQWWTTVQGMQAHRVGTMQEFLEDWRISNYPSLTSILDHHGIWMDPDAFEPDDQVPGIIHVGETQARTFHTLADVDWVQVDLYANAIYSIETLNLLSGADTVLELWDAPNTQGVQLGYNDDRCTSCGDLSSQIVFQPTVSGTYYIMVHRYLSPLRQSVARYGSYDLTVIQR